MGSSHWGPAPSDPMAPGDFFPPVEPPPDDPGDLPDEPPPDDPTKETIGKAIGIGQAILITTAMLGAFQLTWSMRGKKIKRMYG